MMTDALVRYRNAPMEGAASIVGAIWLNMAAT